MRERSDTTVAIRYRAGACLATLFAGIVALALPAAAAAQQPCGRCPIWCWSRDPAIAQEAAATGVVGGLPSMGFCGSVPGTSLGVYRAITPSPYYPPMDGTHRVTQYIPPAPIPSNSLGRIGGGPVVGPPMKVPPAPIGAVPLVPPPAPGASPGLSPLPGTTTSPSGRTVGPARGSP